VRERHYRSVGVLVVTDERILERGGHAGVRAGRRRQLLVGHQLGLHRDPRRDGERLHLIADGRDRPLGERHQPGRGDTDRLPGPRRPFGVTVQHPGAEVKHALVRAQLAGADVERLVIDEQAQQLAVGDVDDRLPGLREAVGDLGVRQRPRLVDPVEIASRQAVRLALLQVAAPSHVAVGQREHRLRLGQQPQVQVGLPKHPGLYLERALHHH